MTLQVNTSGSWKNVLRFDPRAATKCSGACASSSLPAVIER